MALRNQNQLGKLPESGAVPAKGPSQPAGRERQERRSKQPTALHGAAGIKGAPACHPNPRDQSKSNGLSCFWAGALSWKKCVLRDTWLLHSPAALSRACLGGPVHLGAGGTDGARLNRAEVGASMVCPLAPSSGAGFCRGWAKGGSPGAEGAAHGPLSSPLLFFLFRARRSSLCSGRL